MPENSNQSENNQDYQENGLVFASDLLASLVRGLDSEENETNSYSSSDSEE